MQKPHTARPQPQPPNERDGTHALTFNTTKSWHKPAHHSVCVLGTVFGSGNLQHRSVCARIYVAKWRWCWWWWCASGAVQWKEEKKIHAYVFKKKSHAASYAAHHDMLSTRPLCTPFALRCLAPGGGGAPSPIPRLDFAFLQLYIMQPALANQRHCHCACCCAADIDSCAWYSGNVSFVTHLILSLRVYTQTR